jgi:hypothetical protein
MGQRCNAVFSGFMPAILLLVGLLGVGTGCRSAPSVGTHRLIEHQAMIDFTGLEPAGENKPLRVTAAIPTHWDALPVHATALYTHQQWRSPTRRTGVGVAYLRMPLPLSSKAILWFARNEYKKTRTSEGRTIGEWTDAAGRHWFEGENDKYHVRGYVITKGFEAWIIYFGYRLPSLPHAGELNLAARSADRVLPTPLVSPVAPAGSAALVE